MEHSWRVVMHWLQTNTVAPGWLPKQWRHPWVSYLGAVCFLAIAVLLDEVLRAVLPVFAFPGTVILLAIVLTALTLGAGPSLVATLIGTCLTYFIIIPIRFSWVLGDPVDSFRVLTVLVVGSAVSFVAGQTHQARQRAERLASQLEVIFEGVVNGVVVYDREGHPLQMNAAARALLGADAYPEYFSLSLDEQKRLLRPRHEDGRLLTPDQWPALRVLRGEVLLGASSIDVKIHTLDGREVEVNVNGAPLRDATRQIIGGVCIYQDVTERRQLERRTRDALNALLAVAETLVMEPEEAAPAVDQVPAGPAAEMAASAAASGVIKRLAELMSSALGCQRVGVLAVEPDADTLRPMVVTGLSPEREQQWWTVVNGGVRLSDFGHTELAARLRAGEVVIFNMTRTTLGKEARLFGARFVLAAPMRLGEQLVGIMFLDYGGADHQYTPDELAVAGAVAQLGALVIERQRLLREREEARANELAMREANRRMDEFLGIASHELKTPLTSIQGYIQLMARRLNDPRLQVVDAEGFARIVAMMRMVLERSEHSVHRISRLINDLLDDSRIREGRLEFRPERCDLAAIVQDAVEDQRVLDTSRIIRLELPAARPVLVMADANRIGQVVANYVTNALKYSRENQPVEVRLDVEDGTARVSVRDEGVGLPSAEQAHVWDRFYRAAGVDIQSGSGVGMGIGLHICRNIIAGHHGQVGVKSAPGEGSTFWFTLPLA